MPDDSFKEFVSDQLGALPELRARVGSGRANGLISGFFEHVPFPGCALDWAWLCWFDRSGMKRGR